MYQLVHEKILLHRVQHKKDADAFVELYTVYVTPVYRFVALKVSSREDAEDIVSTSFLKAWQRLTDSDIAEPVRNFRAFIYTIARRTIIDSYRERSRKPETPLTDATASQVPDHRDLAETVAVTHEAEQLLSTLQKLKQEYQEVIFLHHVEELSVREIAAILQKSQTAVRVTLHRAVKKMKALSSL